MLIPANMLNDIILIQTHCMDCPLLIYIRIVSAFRSLNNHHNRYENITHLTSWYGPALHIACHSVGNPASNEEQLWLCLSYKPGYLSVLIFGWSVTVDIFMFMSYHLNSLKLYQTLTGKIQPFWQGKDQTAAEMSAITKKKTTPIIELCNKQYLWHPLWIRLHIIPFVRIDQYIIQVTFRIYNHYLSILLPVRAFIKNIDVSNDRLIGVWHGYVLFIPLSDIEINEHGIRVGNRLFVIVITITMLLMTIMTILLVCITVDEHAV